MPRKRNNIRSRARQLFAENLEGRRLLIANGMVTEDFASVGIVNDMCAGTLISPDVVITAVSCGDFRPDPTNTFHDGDVLHNVIFVEAHPTADIAIMILEGVSEDQGVFLNYATIPEEGQEAFLVGFGGTEDAPEFGTKRVGETTISDVFDEELGWDVDKADTLEGDEGAALFAFDVDGDRALFGVVSDGVAIRSDAYLDWIDSFLGGGLAEIVTPEEAAQQLLDNWDEDGSGELSVAEFAKQREFAFGFSADVALEEAQRLTDGFDADGSGGLGFSEIVETIQQEARDFATVDLEGFDADADEKLNLEEYTALFESLGLDNETALWNAELFFDSYDADGDRSMSFDELVVSYGGSVDEEPGPPQPGDADGNGVVDFADFLVLSANFGQETDATFAEGDFDGDGAVGFPDFLILSANFGQDPEVG